MEKVYVGFSYHKGSLLSNIIKMMEGSEYSHVYLRVESKYGPYVYQASGLQVNFTNWDIFSSSNKVVEEYEFQIDGTQKDRLLRFFIKYAGKKYSLKSLFQIASMMICGRLGFKINFKGDNDETFICSELGALFCEKILNIKINEDEDFISPKSLHQYVSKVGVRSK